MDERLDKIRTYLRLLV